MDSFEQAAITLMCPCSPNSINMVLAVKTLKKERVLKLAQGKYTEKDSIKHASIWLASNVFLIDVFSVRMFSC